MSPEIEAKLQAVASNVLEGKTMIRCMPYIKQGTPMLHVGFKDGSSKNLKLQTFESRDRLIEIFKEHAWPSKMLQKNTGQSQ